MAQESPLIESAESGIFSEEIAGSPFKTGWHDGHHASFLKKIIGSARNIYYLYNIKEDKHYFPDNQLEKLLCIKNQSLNPLPKSVLKTIMHPDDFAMHPHFVKSISELADGDIFESEFRLRTKRGEWKWFLSKEMVYERDEQNKVQAIFGVATDITNLKKTEEKVRQSHMKLYAVFESTTDSIFTIDRKYCLLSMNSAFKKVYKSFYGNDPEKGMYVFQDAEPASIYFFESLYKRAFNGERIKENFIREKEDEKFYYEININPVYTLGDADFITCFVKDISDLKKAEEVCSNHKNLLQSIIESTFHSVFSFDTELRYIAFNENHKKTIKRIYGVDIYLGMCIKNVLTHIPEHKRNMEYLQRALNGEQFTNIETYGLPELKQSVHEITFSPIKDDGNVVIGISVFSQNISEKIEAEKQQLVAEKKFRELFENSPDAIFVEDFTGTILDVNKEACSLQGFDKDHLTGMNIRHLVPKNEYRKILTNYKKLYFGTLNSVESRVWSLERGTVPVEIMGKKIVYDDKPALLLQVRDITERKKMEAERLYIEQEKLKQKEEMLLNSIQIREKERNRIAEEIHDEIGAGLSKISVLCEVIKKSSNCAEAVATNIDKILLSSKEVQDSINEIIWAMNPMNDKLENLVAYINYYASEYLETNMLDFHIASPEKIPVVTIVGKTRRNIFLVIKEALNNIVKYTKNCLVTVEIKYKNKTLQLNITDTGAGFDLNQVKRFKNGINNMKKRIEEIHGVFIISSTPGAGTSIHIKIPIQGDV